MSFATGKRSKAISDRSGMAFPYNEMVTEWDGSFVHTSGSGGSMYFLLFSFTAKPMPDWEVFVYTSGSGGIHILLYNITYIINTAGSLGGSI